jgi:hypothetical protein
MDRHNNKKFMCDNARFDLYIYKIIPLYECKQNGEKIQVPIIPTVSPTILAWVPYPKNNRLF